jgi:hypothetical protein
MLHTVKRFDEENFNHIVQVHSTIKEANNDITRFETLTGEIIVRAMRF